MTNGSAMEAVVEAKLPNIQVIRKRRPGQPDRVYHYHRPTQTRLVGKPGSPDYLLSYAEAERRWQGRRTNDFAWLVRQYESDPRYLNFAASTQREYQRLAGALDKAFGTCPIEALTLERFKLIALGYRDEIAARSPREADARLVFLTGVLTWAVKRGHLETNVLKGYERVYRVDRSEMIWGPEQIEAFNAVASAELRLAMLLALYTAQRQGDLLKLPWSAYDGTAITLRQGKTRQRLVIPCTVDLKEALDAAPRRSPLILTTTKGRSWTKRYFAAQWETAAKAAGIADLHFHDLRGTAITNLADAGCTVPEIAAISGHALRSVETILQRYLARTKAQAESAISKLENASRTKSVNRPVNRKDETDAK